MKRWWTCPASAASPPEATKALAATRDGDAGRRRRPCRRGGADRDAARERRRRRVKDHLRRLEARTTISGVCVGTRGFSWYRLQRGGDFYNATRDRGPPAQRAKKIKRRRPRRSAHSSWDAGARPGLRTSPSLPRSGSTSERVPRRTCPLSHRESVRTKRSTATVPTTRRILLQWMSRTPVCLAQVGSAPPPLAPPRDIHDGVEQICFAASRVATKDRETIGLDAREVGFGDLHMYKGPSRYSTFGNAAHGASRWIRGGRCTEQCASSRAPKISGARRASDAEKMRLIASTAHRKKAAVTGRTSRRGVNWRMPLGYLAQLPTPAADHPSVSGLIP